MPKRRSPVWPYLGIVSALCLVACVANWLGGSTMLARATESPDRKSNRGAMPSFDVAVGPEINAPQMRREPAEAHQDATRGTRASEDFAAGRRRGHVAPPIADRTTLEPSLEETPSLPSTPPSPRARPSQADRPPTSAPSPPAGATGALSRRGVESFADIANSWPYPESLVQSMGALEGDPVTLEWSGRVGESLLRLHELESLGDPRAGFLLSQLQRFVHEGMDMARRLDDVGRRATAMRAAYALQRRLAIWVPVHALAVAPVPQASLRDHDPAQVMVQLQVVSQRLNMLTEPRAWRDYLLLDQLAAVAAQRRTTTARQRSELAREFLRRLEAADGTPEQIEFFAQADWQTLAQEMRFWVTEPVDYPALLDDLEQIEAGNGESAAADVARHYQLLRWSLVPEIAELGQRINTYYRNANVRLAVSGELLNRLLPDPGVVSENVNDRLLGGRVFGRSRVTTQLEVVLIPDRNRWRMGLEARGQVRSRTETKRGPARFHNAGRSRYLARKILLVDPGGVHLQDAQATAATATDLTAMETDLDGVPLVNLLARVVARQMYDRQEEEAKLEAQGLLAHRAESRLDEEVELKLGQATSKFRREIWEPLHSLGLRPEAVDMETTQQRLIARYRLASLSQVGAFTPRPQAPASSLLSLQVHESALNNIIASLDLGGREVKLRDLFTEVADKLHRRDYRVPEDVREDVTIQLAAEDPVRFEFKEDRIHVTLRISKLADGDGRVWRDFEVRGMYLSDVDGVRVGLQRDSYIRLRARRGRLSFGDNAALRTIFSCVFAQHPDMDLLASVLVNDQRLHDLRVSQCVIGDGWIGIAVSAGRVRARVADESIDAPWR